MERVRRLRTRETPRDEPTPRPASVREAADARSAASEDFDAGVQVIYGASVQALPLIGLRVSDARPIVQTILQVDPRSPAVVNGRRVQADYVIARGDVLEFVHHAGEKGRTPWIFGSSSRTNRRSAVRTASRRSLRH